MGNGSKFLEWIQKCHKSMSIKSMNILTILVRILSHCRYRAIECVGNNACMYCNEYIWINSRYVTSVARKPADGCPQLTFLSVLPRRWRSHKARVMAGIWTLQRVWHDSGLGKYQVWSESSECCRGRFLHHGAVQHKPAQGWAENGVTAASLSAIMLGQSHHQAFLWLHMRCTFQARTDCKVADNTYNRCAYTHKLTNEWMVPTLGLIVSSR